MSGSSNSSMNVAGSSAKNTFTALATTNAPPSAGTTATIRILRLVDLPMTSLNSAHAVSLEQGGCRANRGRFHIDVIQTPA